MSEDGDLDETETDSGDALARELQPSDEDRTNPSETDPFARGPDSMFQESFQKLTGEAGEADAGADVELQDRYMYGSPLTPVGAFQMVAEEALRDGDIDARDNAILRVFVRGFDIDPEDARVIADVAREKQRLGHLHVRRPFDRLKLYKRMLRYSMAHTGEDDEETALLDRYRRIFKIDETGEAEIRRSARADLRMTESTMIPAQILQLRDLFNKKKPPVEGSRTLELSVQSFPEEILDRTLPDLERPPMPPVPANVSRLFPDDVTLADMPVTETTMVDAPAPDATFSDRTLTEERVLDATVSERTVSDYPLSDATISDVPTYETPVTDVTLSEVTPPPAPRIVAPAPLVQKPVPLKVPPVKPPPTKATDKGPAAVSRPKGFSLANLPGRDQALSLATGFGLLIVINLLRVFAQGRSMPAWPFACFALSLIYATIAMASETEDSSKK